MDFELTQEQKDIQSAAREFAEGEFHEDLISLLEESHEFPYDILRKAGDLGFIGLHYPEEGGGQDYGLFEHVLVTEQLCRKDSGIGIALCSADMGAESIVRFGNQRQQERYLRPLTQGRAISSLVLFDNEEGDDGASNCIPAGADKETYLLRAEKSYVMNGSLADFFIVHCPTDSREQYELVAVIDGDRKAVSVIDMGDKLGIRMLPWSKLMFNDVEISGEDIVSSGSHPASPREDALKVVMVRGGAQSLGVAQGAFDQALIYAKQREQFGRKIGEFQGIRHMLVDMYMDIRSSRLLMYGAASQYDRNGLEVADAVVAKMWADRAATKVTDYALQIFGGTGYMVDTPVEHFYRDARVLRAITGTKLTRKDTVASAIIGKIM